LKACIPFKDVDFNINQIHLFRDIPTEDLQRIYYSISDCEVIEVEAGEIIFDSHSNASCLYIVLNGALALTAHTGLRQIENSATQYLSGECVGEVAVLDNDIHTSTITAITQSQLLVIESHLMWHLIEDFNGIAKNMLQLLSFRIRAANAQLRNRQKVGEFYRQLSMVDGLTGLHNRAWLNLQLPVLIESAHAGQSPLSIIMVDLDHFKKFNDKHGHLIGDDALQTAAKVLNASLRPSDFAARYGGEEMIIILPNTSLEAAHIVAERLCNRIRQAKVLNSNQELPHITASMGLACLEANQDGSTLISKADAALYRAKHAGRDQVSL
jgi:diguanylate cyclase (GGDEF)-like protein